MELTDVGGSLAPRPGGGDPLEEGRQTVGVADECDR